MGRAMLGKQSIGGLYGRRFEGIGLFEDRAESRMLGQQRRGDRKSPVKINADSLAAPIGRRFSRQVSQIDDFIRELDFPCAKRRMRGIVDLRLFASRVREGFVVRAFKDQVSHGHAESLGQLLGRGFGVFDQIMPNGGREGFWIRFAGFHQNIRNRQRMVDVRPFIDAFAALEFMAVGGKKSDGRPA